MGVRLVSGSTQHLLNSASPVGTYPFTIMMWVRPVTVPGSGSYPAAFALFPSSANTINCVVGINGDGAVGSKNYYIQADIAGNGATGANSAISAIAGRWDFVVGRWISSTNRRLAILASTGTIDHCQSTVAGTTTTLTKLTIGAWNGNSVQYPLDCEVGEFTLLNADIQPDGAQLDNAMLWQLAYRGAFSFPHLIPNILDYRSLRHGWDTASDRGGDVYFGARGRQTWANVNGAALGNHPPLLGGYRGPPGSRTSLIIPG